MSKAFCSQENFDSEETNHSFFLSSSSFSLLREILKLQFLKFFSLFHKVLFEAQKPFFFLKEGVLFIKLVDGFKQIILFKHKFLIFIKVRIYLIFVFKIHEAHVGNFILVFIIE